MSFIIVGVYKWVQTSLHELVLWGWVMLKVHFIIWYQSHFEPILASVWWAYQATRYQAVIGPPIICCSTHELVVSAWGGCVGVYKWVQISPHEPVLWGCVRLKVHFVIIILFLWLWAQQYLCYLKQMHYSFACISTIFFLF